jgi:signal transduction histidine kinase
VLIPLKSAGEVFGVVCFGFASRRRFPTEDLRLYNAVAGIAGASMRRAVVLEALERQVNIRTQHLSTLYNINAVASEPLELLSILEQLLKITLKAMHSGTGAIHFLDSSSRVLHLAVHQNLPVALLRDFETLTLDVAFWDNLLSSVNPLLVPDLASEPDLPAELSQLAQDDRQAYIGAPIRAKGQVLGLLSMFGTSILNYTIEDITLFMTIADQIGASIERARLMRQAEQAAVMEERQRLSRELHDSVTQLLYSQVLFAGAGLKVLHSGNDELAERHLVRIDQAAQQALKEMRLLVYQLRPAGTLDDGLVVALERRLEAVEKRANLRAQLVVDGLPNLDEDAEMALYRIAEEALNNTLKHAEASSVTLLLSAREDQVLLEIADDGKGFNLAEQSKGGGMGLVSMRERAAALGSDLVIITAPGSGTRILVRMEAPQ